MRRHLFHGMLADHIQFFCHLVAVIAFKIIIQRFAIAGYGTSDTGCVGSKQRTYCRAIVPQVKDRERRLPLVRMSHHLMLFAYMPIQTLHHLSDGIAEQTTLVIVAVSCMTAHTEVLPRPSINLILLCP